MSELHEHAKKIVMTKQGMLDLEKKLQYLKTTRTAEVAEMISVARGYGDLSENAEYEEAKNEQARLMREIADLEDTIRIAEIVDEKMMSGDKINIGSKVKVEDVDFGEIDEYVIVGAHQDSNDESRISNESPVGAALLGKKTGDTVTIVVPNGTITLKILDVSKE